MRRPARITVGIRDWNGDAVVTIVAGVALLVCLFLPWANEGGRRQGLDWSLRGTDGINGVMQTPFGAPALIIALVVLAVGIAMLALGPRRLAFLLGVVAFVAGSAAGFNATHAAMQAFRWELMTGVGAAGTMLIGLLLLPIGFATAAVGFMIAYWAPRQAAHGAAGSAPAPVEGAPALVPIESPALAPVETSPLLRSGPAPPTGPPAP